MSANGVRWPSVEDQLLATCVRTSFGDREQASVVELSRRNPISWDQVYETARLHQVAPLVYRNLAQLDPSDLRLKNETIERFRRSFARNLASKRHLRAGLWRLLDFLNSQAVDVMLIKGAAMELFGSGSGAYTVSHDVDIILRPYEKDLPHDLVAELFALSETFPLEFDFRGHHDVDLNGALPIEWDRVWSNAIPVRLAGRSFFIMSPEDAMVAACLNACRKRYFNLKALCAIDAYLRDEGVVRWELVAETSRLHEVGDIVYAAVAVTARVMGTPLPANLTEQLGAAGLRAATLDLLSRHFSFSNFRSLYSGRLLANRRVGASLLLPYASYRGDQIWRKLRFAASGPA